MQVDETDDPYVSLWNFLYFLKIRPLLMNWKRRYLFNAIV